MLLETTDDELDCDEEELDCDDEELEDLVLDDVDTALDVDEGSEEVEEGLQPVIVQEPGFSQGPLLAAAVLMRAGKKSNMEARILNDCCDLI